MKTSGQSLNTKQPSLNKRWLVLGLALLGIVAVVLAVVYYVGNNSSRSNGQMTREESIKKGSADVERQGDMSAIEAQLKIWFNQHRAYPSFEQISNDSWAQQNLPAISAEALRAPGASANSMQQTSTPDKEHYGYLTFDAKGNPCQGSNCANYKLFWFSEVDGTVHVKGSTN